MRHSHVLPSGGSTRSRPLLLLWLAALALVMSLIAVGPGAPRAARAADTIMPLSDVTADMTGYVKTVVRGTTISTFDVTVVGVLNDEIPEAGGLIMLKAGGPVIEQTGGIAAGMSGSPVYIDGQLAGAISYGYYFADNTLCLATPAESMMKVLQKSGGVSKSAGLQPGDVLTPKSGSISLAGNDVSKVMLAEGPGSTQKAEPASSATAVFRRLGPLFTLTGVSSNSKAFARAESKLSTGGLPLVAGSGTKGTLDVTIEPGASIGAALITGDINLAGIGTTTYTDGDTVLAWGHPFFWAGAEEYPMVNAEIVGVWPSIAAPFKVGNVGEVVGAFEQDRMHGIAGKLDLTPDTVPETVTITNVNDDTTVALRADLARMLFDPDGMFGWWWSDYPVWVAAERAWDQDKGGTADVTFEVKATDVASGTSVSITRSNSLSSSWSLLWSVDEELLRVLGGVMSAKGGLKVDSVEFEAALDESITTTTIDDVDVNGGGIVPGRNVPVRVTITPYKQNPQIVQLNVKAPRSMRRPYVVSAVAGNSYYGWGQEETDPEDTDEAQALEYYWENKPTSDRIYVSVRGLGDMYYDESYSDYYSGGYGYGYGYGGTPYLEDTKTVSTTMTSTSYVMEASVAKRSSSISARMTPRPVRAGGRVTFSGRITEPGMPSWLSVVGRDEWVRIYRRLPGESGYRKVSSVQTGRRGTYSRTLSVTQTASHYVGWAGNDEYMKDWTGATTVGVPSAVSLSATPRITPVGRSVHLKGSVNPNHSGMTVSLQRLTSRGWRKFADAPLSAGSTYDEVWKPTRRGAHWVRAYLSADADNLAGWSPARAVRVR